MNLNINLFQSVQTALVKLLAVIGLLVLAIVVISLNGEVAGYVLSGFILLVGFWVVFFTRLLEFYKIQVVKLENDAIALGKTEIKWKDICWYRLEMTNAPSFHWVIADGKRRISLHRHIKDHSIEWVQLENILRSRLNELQIPSKSPMDNTPVKVVVGVLVSGYLFIPILMALMELPFDQYRCLIFYIFLTLPFIVLVPLDINRHRKIGRVPYES
ncbi:hypothetical protein [Marinoscillum sp.]|uniref:hypothetical protein n=1 Tax=Marinoscillum sp. TaxID=2024838 RepID=UPI003BAA271F